MPQDIKMQSEFASEGVKANLISPQLTFVLAINLINPVILMRFFFMKINNATS